MSFQLVCREFALGVVAASVERAVYPRAFYDAATAYRANALSDRASGSFCLLLCMADMLVLLPSVNNPVLFYL